jgi:hypothetical protein
MIKSICRENVMSINEDLINKIVEAEWKMFHEVPNIGGQATCQNDLRTFRINRLGQAASWSQATLESYLNDLTEAEKQQRNLLTEKYARMMASTSPAEYAAIQNQIPVLDSEVSSIIEEIIKLILIWEEELKAKYPDITRRGRPIYTSQDSLRVTSIETYLRGELSTYSLKTLKLYHENVLKQKSENINGSEITLGFMMRQYGFSTLQEANEKLKTRG